MPHGFLSIYFCIISLDFFFSKVFMLLQISIMEYPARDDDMVCILYPPITSSQKNRNQRIGK